MACSQNNAAQIKYISEVMSIYYQEDLLIPEKLYPLIGQSIKRHRQQHHMTQERLAELIDVEQKQISHIESGKARTQLPTYLRIANIFHVSMDDLLADALYIDTLPTSAEILRREGEQRLMGSIIQSVLHYLKEKET